MISKELNIVVMPGGSLQTEWAETNDVVTKQQTILQEEIHKRFEADHFSALLFLGFSDKSVPLSSSLIYWRDFAALFDKKLRLTPDLETARHKVHLQLEDDELYSLLDMTPIMVGAEYLNKELITSVWQKLNETFANAIKAYKGTVEDFIKTFSPDVHLVGRVFFHLVENKNDNYPFAFLATYSTKPGSRGESKHIALKAALKEYGENSEKLLFLLTAVHIAANESVLIADLLESGELFHPLAWTTNEAYTFLNEIPLYEKAGILCRIPDWWKGKSSNVSLRISIGEKPPSYVGMDAILDFEPQLIFGDTHISAKEASALLNESAGLVFIKNKWVAVNPDKLKQTLDAYEKAKKLIDQGELSVRDAMRLQLNPNSVINVNNEDTDIGVSNGEWFKTVLSKLRNPELIDAVKPDKNFKAKLRGYQQKGLAWLTFLHSLQFGACLADDMGLGKTIQLLAFLNILKSQNPEYPASLLIIPASLISNWVSEIGKFFPCLKYYVAHPHSYSGKKVVSKSKNELDGYDLVITTYSLSQRYEWLTKYKWRYLILDEAQAIKNPGTKQTKAIKEFTAHNRIVMTGTPVENRLSDLWSIFDFLNPGLLGNAKEFSAFSKNLKDDHKKNGRLRKTYISIHSTQIKIR